MVDKLNVYLQWETPILVGQLVRTGRDVLFKYSDDYLEHGSNISPFRLKFNRLIQQGPATPFKGLFGVFADSLPDAWGQLVMKKHLAKQGIAIETMGALDRLAWVGASGLGALVYKPSLAEEPLVGKAVDLDFLNTNVQAILKGESSAMVDELFQKGGSPGGARPKIHAGYNPATDTLTYGNTTLQEGDEHWIIKFAATIDANDVANIELAYYHMALAAGLTMSESKLFKGKSGKKYFGTKRFDRIGNQKRHMISAAGLLHDDFERSQLDYGTLMQQGKALIGTAKALEQILRQAAFNVFAHNRDDHSKNFAFLMDASGQWEVAPSYDLTFSSSSQGEHSTTCAGNGANPGTKELMELAQHFSIKHGNEIIEEVKEVVCRWNEFAQQAEVGTASSKTIGKVLQQLIQR